MKVNEYLNSGELEAAAAAMPSGYWFDWSSSAGAFRVTGPQGEHIAEVNTPVDALRHAVAHLRNEMARAEAVLAEYDNPRGGNDG